MSTELSTEQRDMLIALLPLIRKEVRFQLHLAQVRGGVTKPREEAVFYTAAAEALAEGLQVGEFTPHLPPCFVDAEWYGVVPIDPARGRFGISLKVGGHKLFLALTPENFRWGVETAYAERTGVQSLKSSDSPSRDVSPQEAE